jgi:pimeloyl-ACP methyl ester carboxylesterase
MTEALMNSFVTRDLAVSGVRVQVMEAGSGEPIVYLHGAGTMTGFDYLLPLAMSRRLIVPIHPGFGGSDDDSQIDSVLDYSIHYAALFNQLGLVEPIDVVGHSLGGWIASMFAIFHGRRVRRLALACPAGLRVSEHPTTDLFMIPPEELLSHLVSSPETLRRFASVVVTNEMRIARYREMTSLARVMWDRNYQPKLERWLEAITMPTLVLWGEQDRIIPVQQAKHWTRRMAKAKIETFSGAGHLLFWESAKAVFSVQSFLEGKPDSAD